MSKPSGGRKRFIFLRSGTLLIGLLLAVLAFAAYFFLGNVLNPPPYQVVIVAQEVSPGETLRQAMLSVDAQQVHPKVAGEYVLQDELSDWLGATVNEPLHPGDPLTKARLVRAGNPAAVRHLAIALEQPDEVAMVIPVGPETCPSRILPGDRVDISFGIGRVQQSGPQAGGLPGQPTPTPPPPFTLPHTAEPGRDEPLGLAAESRSPGLAGTGREPGWGEEKEPLEIPPGATILEESEISEQLEAVLPLAKIVLQSVEVLDIHFEERPNPAYSGDEQGGAQPYIRGDILSLEVVIPAGAVEMLHFAVENGSVRISLLSPNAPTPGERGPTLGMTWEDLAAFFEAERREVLGIEEKETMSVSHLPAAAPTDTAGITGTLPVSPTLAGAVTATPRPSRTPQPTRQPEVEALVLTPLPPTGEEDGLGTAGLALGSIVPFAGGGLALILIPIVVLIVIRRRRRAIPAVPTVPASPTVPAPHQPSLDIKP